MVLYISENFHYNISNIFQLTEQTQAHDRNGYGQCSKGNNSKVGKPELGFMCPACGLKVLYVCVKSPEIISDGISELWRGHE